MSVEQYIRNDPVPRERQILLIDQHSDGPLLGTWEFAWSNPPECPCRLANLSPMRGSRSDTVVILTVMGSPVVFNRRMCSCRTGLHVCRLRHEPLLNHKASVHGITSGRRDSIPLISACDDDPMHDARIFRFCVPQHRSPVHPGFDGGCVGCVGGVNRQQHGTRMDCLAGQCNAQSPRDFGAAVV